VSVHGDLKASGFRPKKSFGQNFLTDANIARVIAHAGGQGLGTVVEIGPGGGALTEHLLALGVAVIAVEKDRELVPVLRERFAEALASGQLTLHEGDATEMDWGALFDGRTGPFGLVGNLPYAVTGALLQRASSLATVVDRATFMIQKEVALRLAAAPASEDYGALTVFVQASYHVKKAHAVPPSCFWPRPEVDSTVVVLTPLRPPRAEETPAFREAVKRAFAQRRKTLRNAWSGIYGLDREGLDARALAAGIALERRGETLAVEDFARFSEGAAASGLASALRGCLGRRHARANRGRLDHAIVPSRAGATAPLLVWIRWRGVAFEVHVRPRFSVAGRGFGESGWRATTDIAFGQQGGLRSGSHAPCSLHERCRSARPLAALAMGFFAVFEAFCLGRRADHSARRTRTSVRRSAAAHVVGSFRYASTTGSSRSSKRVVGNQCPMSARYVSESVAYEPWCTAIA
jgi:16S rRNA (adenine1518-N6/adenine1519-N6)-dimethyltransferase